VGGCLAEDLKIKFLKDQTKELHKSVEFMKEEIKVFNKKLDFLQDNNARIAVEQQGLAEAVRYIVSIADTILEQRKNPQKPTSAHGIQ
jgi:hypothetical protein